MKLNLYEEIKALTQELVAIPSVNKEPGGETRIAEFIRDYYKKIPYFQAHPHQVKMVKTENDFVDRHSTYAYVKGTKGTSSKTVILIGHIDTVGVDDYGSVKEYAYDTQELPGKLEQAFDLSQEVLDDLHSGAYLFGRGALDMKSGVAVHMCLLNYFSRHPEEIDGNIIAIGECDEEDNSKGIITLLDHLVQLKKQEGFDYVACINADYSTNENPKDENRYIYYGSIGKLLPSFIAFGKEAHVGQAFSALDPNLLLAQITKNLSLNTEFCDAKGGEVTIPPISLKQEDTKPDYTVQTALVAHSYFNFFTHGRNPAQVMDLCKGVAVKSFDETVAYLNDQYRAFCRLRSVEFTKLPWKTRVYTWKEFHDELVELHGSVYNNYCVSCKKEYSLDYVMKFGTKIPYCEDCGKMVRPRVTLYEEALEMEVLEAAIDYIARAEVLIVGGTSLVVYPAASLVRYFRGRELVLINRSATPYDNFATAIYNESIAELFKKVDGEVLLDELC